MIPKTKTFPLFTHNKKKNFFFRRVKEIFLIVFSILSGWNFSNVSTVDAALKVFLFQYKQSPFAYLNSKQELFHLSPTKIQIFTLENIHPQLKPAARNFIHGSWLKINRFRESTLETNWKFLNLLASVVHLGKYLKRWN